jgi:hypothetical protein
MSCADPLAHARDGGTVMRVNGQAVLRRGAHSGKDHEEEQVPSG